MGHFEEFKTVFEPSMEWGKLYLPQATWPGPSGTDALRILVFACAHPGEDALQALVRYGKEKKLPFNVVGYVTDDPTDPNARISLEKRLWQLYSPEERRELFRSTVTSALENGIPVYSGSVKSDFFRHWIKDLNPEVAVLNGLGQKLDAYVIRTPKYGIYNFHPSDLSQGVGKGVDPYTAAIESGKSYTRATAHMISEEIDAGPVIGLSPDVRITNKDERYPDSLRPLHMRMMPVCYAMTGVLLEEVLHQKERGFEGPLASIDFGSRMAESVRRLIREPV